MSVLDFLRSQNSIEHAPEPELAPALAAAPPTGVVPGAGPTLGAAAPAMATPAKADPPGIQALYYIENTGKERRYYKDLEGKQLAFRADSKAVTTKQEDRVTVSHMLDVAQARGWTSLHVRGTAAFKQEAWIEAQARGLSVKGYEPTADDRRNVQARRDARPRPQAATTEPAGKPATVIANRSPAPTQASEPAAPAQVVPDVGTTTAAAAPKAARQVRSTPLQTREQAEAKIATHGAASAAARQAATDPVQAQAKERTPRLDRKVGGEANSAEPGADVGQLVERAGEAKREAPALRAGNNATQQQNPRHAREPWMFETNGYAGLSPAQQASAERSHERWVATGTAAKPHTMALDEYVGHVQTKQAEAREKAARLEAKAHQGKERGEAEPPSVPGARVERGVAENGSAEAVQLSANARKVLTFLDQQIETQMANLSDDEKTDLRAHAAKAIAKREKEVGSVKLPAVRTDRKQQAAEATERKTRANGREQKPAQIQQPRMSVG